MRALLAASLLIGPFLVGYILLAQLRLHRTDLKGRQTVFQGSSLFWQLNVFNPRNYNAAGKKLLRWYIAVQVLQLAGMIGAFALIA